MLMAVGGGPADLVTLSGNVGDGDEAARREVRKCVTYKRRLTVGQYSPLAATAAL
jgi:hypothetical protein